MRPTLVILAAGIGSRYGSLKQLDKIGPSGETIIDYSVYDAIQAGFVKVIFVIRKSLEKEFNKEFVNKLKNKISVDYVLQEIDSVPDGIIVSPNREKPWGTGHAVMMANEKINGPFAVINADDFYGRGAFVSLANYYENWSPDYENDYCMVGYIIANTLSDHGTVSRGICKTDRFSNLVEVVEQKHLERTPQGITCKNETGTYNVIPEDTMVSMNFWGFTPSFLRYLTTGFKEFITENAQDNKSEFYIPTMVNNLVKSKRASVKILNCYEQWFGITYKPDRDLVVAKIRELVDKKIYPANLWA
ncbi:MAG: sugar phosphate nucleotidyltransferase [Bacteroidetes bacterium]|nr:sugar phosphate nucleotidyltransferase [Bacteroidota bacterium]